MEMKKLDNLISTLGLIAMYKSWLPVNLRGWVNVLGLYVQERKAGRWARLQAGGSLRSYLDAWQEDDGEWQVKKFDEETWERRFAHLVEPTCEIANFLSERTHWFGDIDNEGSIALNQALQRFRDTGVWSGLPKVPQDVIDEKLKEEAEIKAKEEHEKRSRQISTNERVVMKDPLDRSAWSSLSDLYLKENRYKDLENALRMSLKADMAMLGREYSLTYMQLGKMYLSALSVSIRGKGIPILGWFPSYVDVETLGYNTEQLRDLAIENLTKAYEMDKKTGLTAFLKELELAIKAAEVVSIEAFGEFDRYKEQESQLEQKEREEWLDNIFDSDKDEEDEEEL